MNLKECFEQGLLKRTRKDMAVANKELEVANGYLKKSKKTLEQGILEFSVIGAYTAMFHAARSILFRDGVKERSHVCIGLYIKSKYPTLAQHVIVLNSYRRLRHSALYALEVSIDKDEAEEAIRKAEDFISAIEAVVDENH